MSDFRVYLARTGVNHWTHEQGCRLAVLWLTEHGHDFDDALWAMEPDNALAAQTKTLFEAMHEGEIGNALRARQHIADLVQTAVLAQTQASAEAWLRMRTAWLCDRRHPATPAQQRGQP